MSEPALALSAALLPVLMLFVYIYIADKYQKEPIRKLLLAFIAGVASVVVTLIALLPFKPFIEILDSIQVFGIGIIKAFLTAAIPEESAKLLMLWLVLRKNRYFDEKVDGIVYAAIVSLGFAAFENIMYVFGSWEDWKSVAIVRAIFAVPGHFCFGVLMGYFYSKLKFSLNPSIMDKVLLLLAPILAHGIYDAILFEIENIPAELEGVFLIAFIVFTISVWRKAKKKIAKHLEEDRKYFENTTLD